MPPTLTTFPSSETSAFSQPHQADPCFNFNSRRGGSNATIAADSNVSQTAPMSLQRDIGAPENMVKGTYACCPTFKTLLQMHVQLNFMVSAAVATTHLIELSVV